MSKQTNMYVTQKVRSPQAQILPADTTTLKLLYTASADDAVVKALMVASADTVARVVQIVIEDAAGNQRILGSVSVPANSANAGNIPAVDLLNATSLPGLPMDQNGKKVLPLEAGFKVKVKSTVTVTAGTSLDFNAVVEEY